MSLSLFHQKPSCALAMLMMLSLLKSPLHVMCKQSCSIQWPSSVMRSTTPSCHSPSPPAPPRTLPDHWHISASVSRPCLAPAQAPTSPLLLPSLLEPSCTTTLSLALSPPTLMSTKAPSTSPCSPPTSTSLPTSLCTSHGSTLSSQSSAQLSPTPMPMQSARAAPHPPPTPRFGTLATLAPAALLVAATQALIPTTVTSMAKTR